MKQRIISILILAAMIITLLPMAIPTTLAYSETDIAYPVEGGNIYFDKEDGMITDCDETVTRADIPEQIDGVTVTSISMVAFSDCSSLTSVTIPDSVTFIVCIGGTAFAGCSSLTEINVAEDNPKYSSEDGVLFNKDKTELITFPAGKTDAAYTIPNGVTSIGYDAFAGCSCLTSVTIPDSVTSIGVGAFSDCSSLTNVTIPDSVTEIDSSTFYMCSSLANIIIPESVTRIGNAAFFGCKNLTNVIIPNNVATIAMSAFEACGSLTSVLIPDSVTQIEGYAFSECSALQSVCFLGNAPSLGGCAFQMWDDEAQAYINIPGLTLYYIEGKTGWTTPTWGFDNYATAIWDGVNLPHIHDYTETVTAPTCTEQGYTTHTCECGDSYVDTYVSALGHDYVNGVCSRCGAKDPNYAPSVEFSDVSEKSWYAEAVNYAVTNKLMNGVGNNKFDPEGSMTRAMLVTVLWRYEGEPEAAKNTFSDVPDGQWYTDAVAWAAENGIVGGVGNNKFDPDGNITREQMATILFRYADKKGINTSKRGNLSGFPDGGKVESWAKDAMQWTVAEGIINGSDGKLLPQGNATRAQVSAILMRFIENIVK